MAVVILLMSALQFRSGEYFLFVAFLLLGIWFLCWSAYLNSVLTRNIKRSYNSFIKGFDEDANMSLMIDENIIEAEMGAIKITTKTSEIKKYMETDIAIVIHLDGLIYSTIFREKADNWDQIVSEINEYANKYNTPYTKNLTWSGNPYKK